MTRKNDQHGQEREQLLGRSKATSRLQLNDTIVDTSLHMQQITDEHGHIRFIHPKEMQRARAQHQQSHPTNSHTTTVSTSTQSPDDESKGCLATLHHNSLTPFSAHWREIEAGEDSDIINAKYKRVHHYLATFIFSTIISMLTTAIIISVAYGLKHAEDTEQAWYDDIDFVFHRVAAAITLAAIALTISGLAASIHKFIDWLRGVRTDVDYVVSEYNETDTKSINNDQVSNTIISANPIRMFRLPKLLKTVYPPTPLKTFLWLSLVSLSITTIVNAIKPEFYDYIAQSDYAHHIAIGSIFVIGSSVPAALLTGIHKLTALAIGDHSCCGSRQPGYARL